MADNSLNVAKPVGVTTSKPTSVSDTSTLEAQYGKVEESKLAGDTEVQSRNDSLNEKDVEGVEPEQLSKELSRIDTSDYPKAFSLIMIVVALALSMFLCALGKSPSSTCRSCH